MSPHPPTAQTDQTTFPVQPLADAAVGAYPCVVHLYCGATAADLAFVLNVAPASGAKPGTVTASVADEEELEGLKIQTDLTPVPSVGEQGRSRLQDMVHHADQYLCCLPGTEAPHCGEP